MVAPTRIRATSAPRFLRYGFLGRGQERARDFLYLHDLDQIEVRCDPPLPLQADGEDLGDVEAAVFAAERDAVSVLIPAAGRDSIVWARWNTGKSLVSKAPRGGRR